MKNTFKLPIAFPMQPTVLIFFLMILGGILFFNQKNTPHRVNSSRYPAPMWFMKNTVTQVYDPTGELHYLLQAKRITAYEENEIQFFKPILQLKEGAVPWILSATNGTAFQGKQGTITHFELRNDVLLKREQPQAQLTTSELTYYPASQTVHTEAAVAYQEPHLRITGKGAHVELTKHRVLLNHNVETHYEGLSP